MPESWRDAILQEFVPGRDRLTLVADPDGLITEEDISLHLRARGFEIVLYDDPIAFLFTYETEYRAAWDRGEDRPLVVVLRGPEHVLRQLPYDLLARGRRLAFGLERLFPALSYPVVQTLDRGDLDALYRAQAQHAPARLGERQTKDFLLRHVFGIAPDQIRNPADLLALLLRRHYGGRRLPVPLDERLIQQLGRTDAFRDWPLDRIVTDTEAFLTFLQERWPAFLARHFADELERRGPPDATAEARATYVIAGPTDLPLGQHDVRVYLDNLFQEGWLTPDLPDAIGLAGIDIGAEDWVAVGLRRDPVADRRRRLEALADRAEQTLPGPDALHRAWLDFAQRWAELNALWHGLPDPPEGTSARLLDLQTRVDTVFRTWIEQRYAGLHNQPPVPPVMVHHLPRLLARRLEVLSLKHNSEPTRHAQI
jgi:hypothetical protein